jgi:hypothetical protein
MVKKLRYTADPKVLKKQEKEPALKNRANLYQ